MRRGFFPPTVSSIINRSVISATAVATASRSIFSINNNNNKSSTSNSFIKSNATTPILFQQHRFASFFGRKSVPEETNNATTSIDQDQQQTARKPKITFEDIFHKTKVCFATAASTELIPSVAASEAYDLALTALRAATGNDTLTPNFCFTVISVDHEGMIDAPQVVWKNFSQDVDASKNPITHPEESEKMKNRLMLGTIVRNQRVGDGFIEVMLGHIPDLRYSSFTFDKVPKTVDEYVKLMQNQEIQGSSAAKKNGKKYFAENMPNCFAGFVFSDWRIGGRHPVALADRVNSTNNLMMSLNKEMNENQKEGGNKKPSPPPPLVGAVLPPAESFHVQMKNQFEKEKQEGGQESTSTTTTTTTPNIKIPNDDEVPPSLFFVNDDVFRGSAGAVLLHSNLVSANVSTLMPPVIVKDNVTIDDGSIDESIAVWKINKLGGKTACDLVREIYETDAGLKKRKFSKMFLGLAHPKLRDQPFPLSFVGHLEEGGHISVVLPAFLRDAAVAAKTLTLLRDDEYFESELIGQDLIQFEKTKLADALEGPEQEEDPNTASFSLNPADDEAKKNKNFASKVERVRVHRERNADIVVANACGLHFSHPQLYTIFQREKSLDEGLLRVGGGNMEKHAPSVLRRVLGKNLPNTGMHASGVLVPFVNNNNNEGGEVIPPQMLPRASTHLIFTPTTML